MVMLRLAAKASATSSAANGQTGTRVPPAGQVPVRSVDAYFFQGRSIKNG
jgi:hypothetical protein